jgi:hypothetical protein
MVDNKSHKIDINAAKPRRSGSDDEREREHKAKNMRYKMDIGYTENTPYYQI